jgi:hypothetical protein
MIELTAEPIQNVSIPESDISFTNTKRGRVLSAINEKRIREARDSLDNVLKQLDEQPETPREESAPPEIVKGAIASHETPKADPGMAWDGPAVVASLPNDRAVLRRVHAWFDDKGDPDAKQSYKFPHHLSDGRVVLRGVNNARARLPQASIPDDDRAGVDRHLVVHQEQFEKAVVLRDFARALAVYADELEGVSAHLGEEDEHVHNEDLLLDPDTEKWLSEQFNILAEQLKGVVTT